MNESKSNSSQEFAKKRLLEACRAKDTSVRLAWAITMGEALLLGVLAVALMDYWLMLPVWVRSVGASALGLLAAFGVYRLVRFFRRPTRLKEAALELETQRPELGCEISTAAEYLSGERQTTKDYEPELVSALENKAAENLRGASIAYERRLLRPGVILFVILLGLLIFIGAAPVAFTALTRAALPFSKAHYTHVEVKPGNVEIPVGQDLELTNLFSGRMPKDPTIHWQQPGEAQWHATPLSRRSSDGAYLFTFKNLRADLKYRVTGNDAVSEDYNVATYIPPEVKDLTIRIEYPEYTHLKPIEQKSEDVAAVRASTFQVRIEPSVPLSNAKLHFVGATNDLALQSDATGVWTGSLKIAKDSDYWIELADLKGHRGGDDKPHHIKALPDAPPRVEINDPGQDTHAAATNKVPVKISVSDDFGVSQITLVFNKLGGPERSIQAAVGRDEKGIWTANAELDLSTLDLKEFELVAYHAEARDNNTLDGPGIGKSPVYFVENTDLKAGDNPKKPGQPAQTANLLDIQKQIVAETTALESNAPTNQFKDLAARQRDAQDFGKIYLQALTGKAPAAAVSEMEAAVSEMEKAGGQLDKQRRADALPPEESALAHLYQVLKQMPELKDLPTEPKPGQPKLPATNQLAVVLEAIKEKKKAQPGDQAVEQALQQALALAQQQRKLNLAMRHPEQGAQGQAQGKGDAETPNQKNPQDGASDPNSPPTAQGKEDANANAQEPQLAAAEGSQSKAPDQDKGQGQGQGKGQGKGKGDLQKQAKADAQGQAQDNGQGKGKGDSQKQAKADAQGQGKGQGKGNGKAQGQGQGQGQGDPNQAPPEMADQQQPPPSDPDKLSEQEQELSEKAQELADKLDRLAGHDKRVGHNAGQNARLGGQKIARASEEIKKGNFGAAGVNGFQGEQALSEVAAQLQHALKERPEMTDVANEEAPKQYESLISEYFKKLSHAE